MSLGECTIARQFFLFLFQSVTNSARKACCFLALKRATSTIKRAYHSRRGYFKNGGNVFEMACGVSSLFVRYRKAKACQQEEQQLT